MLKPPCSHPVHQWHISMFLSPWRSSQTKSGFKKVHLPRKTPYLEIHKEGIRNVIFVSLDGPFQKEGLVGWHFMKHHLLNAGPAHCPGGSWAESLTWSCQRPTRAATSAGPRPNSTARGCRLPFLLLHIIVKSFGKESAGRYLPARGVSSAQYCRDTGLELQPQVPWQAKPDHCLPSPPLPVGRLLSEPI